MCDTGAEHDSPVSGKTIRLTDSEMRLYFRSTSFKSSVVYSSHNALCQQFLMYKDITHHNCGLTGKASDSEMQNKHIFFSFPQKLWL